MVMGWFWACGFSVVFWGPFWEAVWSCAAALSFPARRTCLNAEAICTGITRRKKIRIRAPATRHWPRSMRDPNPFACHPPPRAALDCRILARGDCGPAKLAVGSLINCHWCAVGVLGLPLLGRRAAGFPGAGSRVSFAAARSAENNCRWMGGWIAEMVLCDMHRITHIMTPKESPTPPPPTPPSLKRLSLGKCLDKLLSHYLLSKVCFWILLLPREGSRVTIPDCSILLSMPLCNTLKNIDLEQARYHPEAYYIYIL